MDRQNLGESTTSSGTVDGSERADFVQPTENSRRVEAGLGPMEILSRERIKLVREEMKEGKSDKGYPDLLTLLGTFNHPIAVQLD